MSQKVAVVTGGTRGIGLAISLSLIAQGYKVAAVYFGNDDAARKFEQESNGNGKAFKFDVSDYAACEAGCEDIVAALGPIDILVNNAGITRDGVFHKMPRDSWDAVLSTNLNSCFNMCRLVVGSMRDRGFGRIINISSINGQKGQFGQVNYAAAKAGMIGFSKALALESAAKGITVNTVCPGYIATEMTGEMNQDVLDSIVKQIPTGRMGEPREIADLVAFLASDKASFITGATLSANGGQYMA